MGSLRRMIVGIAVSLIALDVVLLLFSHRNSLLHIQREGIAVVPFLRNGVAPTTRIRETAPVMTVPTNDPLAPTDPPHCSTMQSMWAASMVLQPSQQWRVVSQWIHILANASRGVAVAGTDDERVLSAVVTAEPDTLILYHSRLGPTAELLLRGYNRCHRGRSRSKFTVEYDLLKEQHDIESLFVGSIELAMTLLADEFASRRYVLIFDPAATRSLWVDFDLALSAFLAQHSEWRVEVKVEVLRFVLLMHTAVETRALWQTGYHALSRSSVSQYFMAIMMNITHNTNPAVNLNEFVAGEDVPEDMVFFEHAHKPYSRFVDEKTLTKRYEEDAEISSRFEVALEERVRTAIFECEKEFEPLQSRRSRGTQLSEDDEAVWKALRSQLEGLVKLEQENRGMVRAAAERRSHAFHNQLDVFHRRQMGGLKEYDDIVDDGNVNDFSFAMEWKPDTAALLAQCANAFAPLQCDATCTMRVCPPEPNWSKNPLDNVFRRLATTTGWPVSYYALIIESLVYGSQYVTVLDCHPQLILTALHAVLTRPATVDHSFTLVNGHACGLGVIRKFFAQARTTRFMRLTRRCQRRRTLFYCSRRPSRRTESRSRTWAPPNTLSLSESPCGTPGTTSQGRTGAPRS